jgi:hypothetical protein
MMLNDQLRAAVLSSDARGEIELILFIRRYHK